MDDNAIMRRALRNLLETQDDWRVCDEASDGREAVAKFDKEKFDVIVLDFQMPGMNGLQDRLARYRQIKISVIGRKSGQTVSIPVRVALHFCLGIGGQAVDLGLGSSGIGVDKTSGFENQHGCVLRF